MRSRRAQLSIVIIALALLYAGSAAFLFRAMPEPHQNFELMVVGTGAAGITMFGFYLLCLVHSRR
jgi:hypothetical protein